MERKASLTRWGLVCVVVLLAGIFLIHSEYLISLVNLSKYDGVYYDMEFSVNDIAIGIKDALKEDEEDE